MGGVDQNPIPIDGERFGIAHGGEEHAAGGGLLVNLPNGIGIPVGVFPRGTVAFDNFQRPDGTDQDAALAVDASALVGQHQPAALIKAVHAVGALPLAEAAPGAAAVVPNHLELRIKILYFHQYAPSFTRTMTGSPPMGA